MNRERAEAHLRLLAEEELRRAAVGGWDGPSANRPDDDAVGLDDVLGAVAGSVAGPGGWVGSGRGWSADRAVAELYRVHYRELVRLAALLVRDVQVAQEVVQDSFAAMHGGWPRLRGADKALAYLRQAVVNRSRAVLRHRAGQGGGPRQVRPGGSGEQLAQVASAAQLLTAVDRRVAQHASSKLRLARVAQMLTAVGALDAEAADQILGDFELALAIRQAGSPAWPGPDPRGWRRSSRVRPRPAARSGTTPGPAPAPGRVVRLGQVIPVRGEDADGEVYLLSYAQTASGPQLSLLAPARPRCARSSCRR